MVSTPVCLETAGEGDPCAPAEITPSPARSRSAFAATLLCWLALGAAAVWLLRPALDPVHVEGFSASMVALGVHLAHHDVRNFLPFAGLNADYYGLTKLGVVLGVAWLSPLLGADGAMRVQMLLGLASCLGASVYLIRRWAEVSWLTAATTVLLISGIAESGFFFNDNVPAAGLMLLALALWTQRVSTASSLVAGLLIGCAIAYRTDIVLVAIPAVPLIAIRSCSLAEAAAKTALAAITAIALLFCLYALVGASPIDSLRVGRAAVELWDRPASLLRHFIIFLFFCGAPALFLLALGFSRLARSRDRMRQLLLIGVPLFVNLVLLGKTWEVRQLLPLAPFLGAIIAIGIRGVADEWRSGSRIVPAACAALIGVSLLSPPAPLIRSDGPRMLTGRFQSIALWQAWQAAVHADFAGIDALVDGAPHGGTLAVLTDGWNDDRYLHLELVRHGFHRVPLPSPCERIGIGMRTGDRLIVQLSMVQTFVPYFPALRAARLERYALPCLASIRPTRSALLANEDRVAELTAAPGRNSGSEQAGTARGFREIFALPLDRNRLETLDRIYIELGREFGRAPSAEEAIALTRSQTGFSR